MDIDRIVLAVEDMAAMVGFYDAVFDADLDAVGDPDSFHVGVFCGLPLLLCPNDIAEVDARQSRTQWRLRVDDLDTTLAAATATGGRVLHDDVVNGVRNAAIVDPDGNTYELVAA